MSYYAKGLKYSSLEELIEGYKSGKITDPLIIDNSSLFLYEADECVFRFEASAEGGFLQDLLNYVGIKHDEA